LNLLTSITEEGDCPSPRKEESEVDLRSQRLLRLLSSRTGRLFLQHLAEVGSATPALLSSTLGVTVQRVHQLADLFEEAHMLVSRRSGNSRLLTITEKGRKAAITVYSLLRLI